MYDALQQDPTAQSFFSDPSGAKNFAKGRFYFEAVKDEAASLEAGCAIFKDVEFVEIRHPGDRSYSWLGEVTEEHKRMWPEQYKVFKESAGEQIAGTPIEQWPPLTKADVANLKALHIVSVEDLATVPDSSIDKLGHGGRALRDKAYAWLESAQKGAAGLQAAAEAARLREQLEAVQAQMAEMAKQFEASKRGKRKDDEAA